MADTQTRRGPGRPPREPVRETVREDSPRARAATRAAELREHLGDLDEGEDRFAVDLSTVPDGWTYEWKRRTVYNLSDPSYDVQVARAGWEPVPLDRHPDLMPPGHRGKLIERDGMVLCERPTEIVHERQQIELRRARAQLRAKEEQLGAAPEGHFERSNKDKGSLAKVSRTYDYEEPIPIPD